MHRQRSRSRRPFPIHALKRIVWAQRRLSFCLIAHLLLWICFIASNIFIFDIHINANTSNIFELVSIISLILGLISGIVVFLIERKLSNLACGIILGLFTVLPCLGFIFILIVNVRATNALQSCNIRVGFFGASRADLEFLSEDFTHDDAGEPTQKSWNLYEVNESEGW